MVNSSNARSGLAERHGKNSKRAKVRFSGQYFDEFCLHKCLKLHKVVSFDIALRKIGLKVLLKTLHSVLSSVISSRFIQLNDKFNKIYLILSSVHCFFFVVYFERYFSSTVGEHTETKLSTSACIQVKQALSNLCIPSKWHRLSSTNTPTPSNSSAQS